MNLLNNSNTIIILEALSTYKGAGTISQLIWLWFALISKSMLLKRAYRFHELMDLVLT